MSTDIVTCTKFNEETLGDGYYQITINRPDKLNALNRDVLDALMAIIEKLKSEKTKAAFIVGAGEKAFVAGADISQMSSMDPKEGEKFAKFGQSVTLQIEQAPFPIIACVAGFALGGGCELALACDFIYATAQSIFGQPEVKLGLIPGFGGTQRLAKLVNRAKAKELVYTGKNIPAPEAFEIGIVNELFETKEDMLDAVCEFFKIISKNSPLAIRKAKECLVEGVDLTTAQGLEIEASTFGSLFNSHDMKEGTTAFVEKRKPNFKGE